MSTEGNALFLFDDIASAGAVVADSEEVAMPDDNLINLTRSSVWRSTAGTSSELEFTLPAGDSFRYIALIDINLTTNGTIQIEGWTDAIDGSTKVYDETHNLSDGHLGWNTGVFGLGTFSQRADISLPTRNVVLFDTEQYNMGDRYWKLTLTDTDSSYQQCACVVFARDSRPAVNASWDWTFSLDYRSDIKTSLSGVEYSIDREDKRVFNLSWDWLNDLERNKYMQRAYAFKNNKPFVFCLFPDDISQKPSHTIWGRFNSNQISQQFVNINKFNTQIIEVL